MFKCFTGDIFRTLNVTFGIPVIFYCCSSITSYAEYPDVTCTEPGVVESGFVAVFSKVGDSYTYTFGEDSFTGEIVQGHELVKIEVQNSGQPNCGFVVTSMTTNKIIFYINQIYLTKYDSERGKLVPAPDSGLKVPDLNCEISSEVLKALCPSPVKRSDIIPQDNESGASSAIREG